MRYVDFFFEFVHNAALRPTTHLRICVYLRVLEFQVKIHVHVVR